MGSTLRPTAGSSGVRLLLPAERPEPQTWGSEGKKALHPIFWESSEAGKCQKDGQTDGCDQTHSDMSTCFTVCAPRRTPTPSHASSRSLPHVGHEQQHCPPARHPQARGCMIRTKREPLFCHDCIPRQERNAQHTVNTHSPAVSKWTFVTQALNLGRAGPGGKPIPAGAPLDLCRPRKGALKKHYCCFHPAPSPSDGHSPGNTSPGRDLGRAGHHSFPSRLFPSELDIISLRAGW